MMLKSLINRIFPRSYLAARHGALGRHFAAAGAFCAALGLTRSATLARENAASFRRDDYAAGLARLAWYARRRFPRTDLSSDPLHLFCAGMTARELDAMRGFLTRQGGHLPPETLHGELAFIAACTVVETLGTPRYGADVARLRSDADALLGHALAGAQTPPTQAATTAAEKPKAERQKLDRSQAEATLRDTLALLEGEGFRPFMLSGTLLGAVREGRILDHDYDIDLGLFAEEAELARLESVLAQDPKLGGIRKEYQTVIDYSVNQPVRIDIPVIYKLRHDSGVTVDLFLHYREDGTIWHGSALYRWSNSPFTLAPRDLGGVRLLAPEDAERNLAENYGDWQKPKYAFHCALDTPNLVLHHAPLALAVAVRRLAMLRARPEDAARLVAQMEAAGFIERNSADSPHISGTIFAPHT